MFPVSQAWAVLLKFLLCGSLPKRELEPDGRGKWTRFRASSLNRLDNNRSFNQLDESRKLRRAWISSTTIEGWIDTTNPTPIQSLCPSVADIFNPKTCTKPFSPKMDDKSQLVEKEQNIWLESCLPVRTSPFKVKFPRVNLYIVSKGHFMVPKGQSTPTKGDQS